MRRFHGSLLVASVLTAFVWLLETPASAPVQEGKRYAVLVGPRRYDHSKLPLLEYTENDVTELAEVLRGAGYEVVLLTDTTGQKDDKLAPTKANIEPPAAGGAG